MLRKFSTENDTSFKTKPPIQLARMRQNGYLR